MDWEVIAGAILFGFPIWLAIIIWIWKKVFKIRSIWD